MQHLWTRTTCYFDCQHALNYFYLVMKKFTEILFLCCTILLSWNGFGQSGQPNILFIISDDHALQTIDAYGEAYGITPHIDRIAREGVIFNNAFVTNSICAPSRAVLLTGKYSHKNGHKDNMSRFDAAQDVFPARLQEVGYQTAWIGKWHLQSYPQGFHYWHILPGQGYYYNPDFISMEGDTSRIQGYCTDIITDLTLEWLENRQQDQPFCLVVGEKATHRTWMPDLQDLGRFDEVAFPLPENFWDDYTGRQAAQKQNMTISETLRIGYDLKIDAHTGFGSDNYTRFTPEQQEKWDAYYEKVEKAFKEKKLSGKALVQWKYQRYMQDYLSTAVSLDRNIGKILDYLDAQGLTQNTIVIYTSDQGFYMGEHGWFDKRFMYEESMRMPFVMRYPGKVKPGSEINELVMNIDFAPTLLEAAGATIPEAIQGKSVLPLLEEAKIQWREAVYYHYYEYPGEHQVMPHFGIRTQDYKLIRFYGEGDFWELYDLQQDPGEMNNLYGKPAYEKITLTLKEGLKALIRQYEDHEAMDLLSEAKP